MTIRMTRDSVCMADDVDAPHETFMEVQDDLSMAEIIGLISRSGYLASIAGGMASWSVESGRPIAVVAQQWAEPKMLVDSGKDGTAQLKVGSSLQLHFRYHAQEDPDAVLATLLARSRG